MMTATTERTPCEKRIYIFPSNVANSLSPKYKELGHFTLLFAEYGKEMHQDSKRTCTAIVLFIKRFVWCRSRHRRRRSLLKLPIVR